MKTMRWSSQESHLNPFIYRSHPSKLPDEKSIRLQKDPTAHQSVEALKSIDQIRFTSKSPKIAAPSQWVTHLMMTKVVTGFSVKEARQRTVKLSIVTTDVPEQWKKDFIIALYLCTCWQLVSIKLRSCLEMYLNVVCLIYNFVSNFCWLQKFIKQPCQSQHIPVLWSLFFILNLSYAKRSKMFNWYQQNSSNSPLLTVSH